jgi:hypothetical protein
MFGRITKQRRTQFYVSRTTSQGHVKSRSLTNKRKDVLCPRVTHCAAKKKILFPSSFWGIFDFFVLFNNFENIEKE